MATNVSPMFSTITLARKIPAKAAIIKAKAQVNANTFRTFTPIKVAVSWSFAVPLMASPIRVNLKNKKKMTVKTTATTIVHRWV